MNITELLLDQKIHQPQQFCLYLKQLFAFQDRISVMQSFVLNYKNVEFFFYKRLRILFCVEKLSSMNYIVFSSEFFQA